jgi:hypothetical protein
MSLPTDDRINVDSVYIIMETRDLNHPRQIYAANQLSDRLKDNWRQEMTSWTDSMTMTAPTINNDKSYDKFYYFVYFIILKSYQGVISCRQARAATASASGYH